MRFSVRFSLVNNSKSLGHRPVDPCLSRRVSQGHPAGVPGISLKFMCPFSGITTYHKFLENFAVAKTVTAIQLESAGQNKGKSNGNDKSAHKIPFLGGHFDHEKKYFAPLSGFTQTPSRPLAPPPSPLLGDLPPGFSIKTEPPPPLLAPRTPPSPPPKQKK